ncbi:MAG: hypothetical protein ACK4IC_05290 [Erythrobacter sp.]
MDDLSMLAYPAVPAPQSDLHALEAFPWLVRADAAEPTITDGSGKAGREGAKRLIHAGIAFAFAALCGGASYLALGMIEEPAALVQPASVPQAIAAPATFAAAEANAAEAAAGSAAAGEARQARLIEQEQTARASQAARMGPPEPARKPSPAPRINPAPVTGHALASEAVGATATPSHPTPPEVVDHPASAATLQAYRTAMDESRAAVREVIRLASRQKPPRDASAEAQTGYRHRQQNAAAARDYRKYLDTLARSMRGTPSETVAQQSLERARQTLGYLKRMQADSQASLW